jgi:hypothetical protein
MQPSPASPATPHSTHDLVLLAAAADRHPDPATEAAAADQAAHCDECASLLADLRALAGGLAALPAAMPAPRDMRLTAEQAARLRQGQLWRRLLRPFGPGGLPNLRPLAAALTALGLAGILLSAIPLGLGAGAALAPLPQAGNPAANPAASGAGGEDYDGAYAPGSSARAIEGQGSTASASPTQATKGVDQAEASQRTSVTPAAPESRSGPSLPPLTLMSLGLLVAGLGLFAVLLIARRVA